MLAPGGVAHASTIGQPVNNLGLVGYWTFDEGSGTKALDYSGNGNTGTLVNSPSWVSGKHGDALSFDGSTSYVSVADADSLTPTGAALTISAWFYTASSTSGAIATKWDGTGSNFEYFLSLTAGSKIDFDIGTSIGGWQTDLVSATTITTGRWYHVVAVYDGSHLKLYIDNVQDANTLARTNTLKNGTTILAIGHNADTSNSCQSSVACKDNFEGQIDDVRIYNRALTATEVSALYHQGEAQIQTANRNGLVGEWKFDEGSGTKAMDSSGNGNTGTLTSGVTWMTGKHGNAASFNGTNQVQLNSMSPLTTYTVSSWVKFNATPHSYDIIYASAGNAGGSGIDFRFESGKLKLYSGGSGSYVVSSGTYGPANGWMLVTATRDSGGTGTLYVNGQYLTSNAISAPNSSYFGSPLIGNYLIDRTDTGFQGSLDDLRIYNRALSASEIQALYKSGEVQMGVNTAKGTLNQGLVGYWSFNGPDLTSTIAYDRSGNANNGTLENSPSPTLGEVGQALSFNGSNQDVSLGNINILNGAHAFTVSAWVYKAIAGNFPAHDGIFDIGSSANRMPFIWGNSGTTFLTMQFQTTTGGASDCSVSSTAVPANAWVHVVATWDGSTCRFYLNGVAGTADPTAGNTLVNNDGYGYIGHIPSYGYWPGKIDEVRIYNRALSASEVKQLYLAGK